VGGRFSDQTTPISSSKKASGGSTTRVKSWKDTLVGVAFSKNLLGPYERYGNNHLCKGHAFAVWKQGTGCAALWSNGRDSFTYWSKDGLNFKHYGQFSAATPGVFRPDNRKDGFSRGINWGVDTTYRSKRGKELEKYTNVGSARQRYIVRFECELLMDEK